MENIPRKEQQSVPFVKHTVQSRLPGTSRQKNQILKWLMKFINKTFSQQMFETALLNG